MTKTLSVVIERPMEAAFREVTLTPKREDTVVAKTRMSAISTGTDMKTYHGLQHPEQCWYPLVPGYENMGVILEEGAYAPGLKKGDRVKTGTLIADADDVISADVHSSGRSL